MSVLEYDDLLQFFVIFEDEYYANADRGTHGDMPVAHPQLTDLLAYARKNLK